MKSLLQVQSIAQAKNQFQSQKETINQLHAECVKSRQEYLKNAILIGEALVEVKKDLPHGQWLSWVTQNLPFTDQCARNYIRLYEHRDDPKFKTVLNLTEAYKLLAPPKSEASWNTWLLIFLLREKFPDDFQKFCLEHSIQAWLIDITGEFIGAVTV